MHSIVYYYPTGHEQHHLAGHPERPERVETIRAALEKAGFWQAGEQLDAKPASMSVLRKVHSAEHLQTVEWAARQSSALDEDTYLLPATWDLARRVVGGARATAAAVWRGEAACGLALTRPPGHHATPDQAMGFCLFNNVALAAEGLIELGARRLAIIDLDLHHGNGTQDIFYQRGDVFFVSTHQIPLYPGTGALDETGQGAGLGATANCPLPPGTGDAGFQAFMDELILPLLDRFSPEMLLVSAGFDPHWRDPLGHLRLSAAGYGALVRSLAGWARRNVDGRICLCLEGGYDVEAGAACCTAAVAALLDQPFSDSIGPSPRPEGHSWQPVLSAAKELWELENNGSCLR